jgi:hypothetical protein
LIFYFYTHVPVEIVTIAKRKKQPKSWMEETTQKLDGHTDKLNVVCICSGILFSLEKEGNPDICYSRDENLKTSH